MTPEEAIKEIIIEYGRATEQNGPFNSLHEGYAILLEEMDELWSEIKMKPENRSMKCIREEAIQVGAMALRLLIDCC